MYAFSLPYQPHMAGSKLRKCNLKYVTMKRQIERERKSAFIRSSLQRHMVSDKRPTFIQLPRNIYLIKYQGQLSCLCYLVMRIKTENLQRNLNG